MIEIVDPKFTDMAWADGADCLAEACDTVGDVTVSQLKMLISRGERILVRLSDETGIKGWGCCRIDQLPNVRVMHITELVCHNSHFERFFDEFCTEARKIGASEVRCSCKPAQARLFKRTNKFEEVFTTLRVKL